MATIHDFSEWCFIPGPERDPPESSLELDDIVEYPLAVIADAFLAYPGVRLLHPAEPSWWQWAARWEDGGRFIELDMTLFETEPISWGGSGGQSRCTLETCWDCGRRCAGACPAVWLHNGLCEILTPESFQNRYRT